MRQLGIVILLLAAIAGTCLAIRLQKATSDTVHGTAVVAAKDGPAIPKPSAQEVRERHRDDFRLLLQCRQGRPATVGVMAAAKRVFVESKDEFLLEGLTVEQVKDLLGQPRQVQNAKEAPHWTALHYAYQRGPDLVKATLTFQDGRCYAHIFSMSHSDSSPGLSLEIEWKHKVAPPQWLLESERPSAKGTPRSRG